MSKKTILIIGCGSIGERHVRAFRKNDQVKVIAAETNSELRRHIAAKYLEGVDVEDTVNVITRQESALVSYQLNQFQSPNEIVFDFHSATGSVRIEIHNQRWGTFAHGAAEWIWHDARVPDRDFLFQSQARAFVAAMSGENTPFATLEEGVRAVAFNQAAFQSVDESHSKGVRPLFVCDSNRIQTTA